MIPVPRVLGLDWGEKNTGIAVSDEHARLAVGYDVWPTQEVLSRIRPVVASEDIGTIVVGYPLTLRGEIGSSARKVDRFIAGLAVLDIPIVRWDERLTTFEASAALTRIGVPQRQQRGRVDVAAAVIMLQSYLDQLRSSEEDQRGG